MDCVRDDVRRMCCVRGAACRDDVRRMCCVRGAACGRWCSSPSEDQMSASAAQSLDAMMNGQTRLRGSREMTDDCYNR